MTPSLSSALLCSGLPVARLLLPVSAMHELSLAEGVREIIEETVRAQGLGRVRMVLLEIGALAAVEAEALVFCLEAVLKGSVAEGAKVDVAVVPGAGWCPTCAATVPVAQRFDPCPRCGGYQLKVTQGMEMRVKALDVADA